MAALSGGDGVGQAGNGDPVAPSGIALVLALALELGRPSVEREIRDLIRQMSSDNPLWGTPRIHGELLKFGIEIGQATVAKYMVRRRGAPSPTWRTFLRNHAEGIAAIDMFVVMSASFRLLYFTVILAYERRTIIHTAVAETSHCGLVIASGNRSVSMGHCSALSAARPRCLVWPALPQASRPDGDHRSHHGTTVTFAERLHRTRDRFDPSRVFGPHRDLQQAPSAPRPVLVRRLLPKHPQTSCARQELAPTHAG